MTTKGRTWFPREWGVSMGWGWSCQGFGEMECVEVSRNVQFSDGTGCFPLWQSLDTSHTSVAGDTQLLGIVLELQWQNDGAAWCKPGPAERLLLLMLSTVPLQAVWHGSGASASTAAPWSSTLPGYAKQTNKQPQPPAQPLQANLTESLHGKTEQGFTLREPLLCITSKCAKLFTIRQTSLEEIYGGT